MAENNEMHIRHCLLYEFVKGNSAAAATKSILKNVGVKSVNRRTSQKWFRRFRDGNFKLDDIKRSGQQREMDIEALTALIEAEPNLTAQELSIRLNKSCSTILQYLHQMGKMSKYGKWIPKELSELNLSQRLNVCISLLSRYELKPFLNRIITSDIKWIIYGNRNKQMKLKNIEDAVNNNVNTVEKKCMISIWWDERGIIYYELLKPYVNITPKLYDEQILTLYECLKKKRLELIENNKCNFILQNDNTNLDILKIIQNRIKLYNWELLPHPPFSPDLIPSNYHLIKHIQNYLNDQILDNEIDVKYAIDKFISLKSEEFYLNGINKLPNLWIDVINNNGKYIIDEE